MNFWKFLLTLIINSFILAQQTDVTFPETDNNKTLDPLNRPANCPPCFNCNLPGFECLHFGDCDNTTGNCICPPGFGSPDCSEPLCGGLGESYRPLRSQTSNKTHCNCSPGWEGINCNMCTMNSVCNKIMPNGVNGTCYKGGILVEKNYHMCAVTNQKIIDILHGVVPEVTFSCEKGKTTNSSSELSLTNKDDNEAQGGKCGLQLWVNNLESFHCGFKNCEFSVKNNNTLYECSETTCRCSPGGFFCGHKDSFDLSSFLSKNVNGNTQISCNTNNGDCRFSEPSLNGLITSVFGDSSITLNCASSECLHYSKLPDYSRPVKKVSPIYITLGVVLSLLFFLFAWLIYRQIRKKSKKLPDDLPKSDETGKLFGYKPGSLDFDGINYSDICRDSEEKDEVISILDGNICGSVKPGQTLAIMGGSGAGKTTLLDILARKKKRGRTHGNIYINGSKDYTNSQYKRMIGFVDQEVCLHSTLTVYETILMSALLRLPKSMSYTAKKQRVVETIKELGISHIQDRLIGNETRRGISGGEKRRVSIACELVTSPSILFLDEPTSGLDSFSAYNVIESLVNLVRTYNRTVVFTIHQPRPNIIQLFDNLILLCDGKLMYSGPYSECEQYYLELGYEIPKGYNAADFLVDLTMKLANNESDLSSKTLLCNSTPLNLDSVNIDKKDFQIDLQLFPHEGFDEISSYNEKNSNQLDQKLNSDTNQFPNYTLNQLVTLFEESSLAKRISDNISSFQNNSESSEKHNYSLNNSHVQRISFCQQLFIISGRTFKNLYRDPLLLLTHYAMAVVLAVFSGVVYFKISDDISGFQNRLGLFFFLLSLFGFSTLTSLNLLVGVDRIIFMRERAKGYYHPLVYYLGKIIYEMISLRIFPPLIFGSILYPIVGLRPAVEAFFIFVMTLTIFNLCCSGIVLVIGISLGSNPGVANLVGILVMLFSMLFAGLFVNHDSFKIFGIDKLQYLSVFHYAYEAISINEVKSLMLIENKFGLAIEVPGAVILSTFGFSVTTLMRDILALVGVLGFVLILGYVGLHFVLVEMR